MGTISFRKCEPPARARIERRRRSYFPVPGSLNGATFDEYDEVVRPDPPNGRYFEIGFHDDEPVSPTEAISALVRGEATIDDPDAASAVVEWLRGLDVDREHVEAWGDVLGAYFRLQRAERIEAVYATLGIESGDAVLPGVPKLLTSEEVAAIFRVDDSTVRRWAGSTLPGAFKVGRKWLFRAEAILNLLLQGPTEVVDPFAKDAA